MLSAEFSCNAAIAEQLGSAADRYADIIALKVKATFDEDVELLTEHLMSDIYNEPIKTNHGDTVDRDSFLLVINEMILWGQRQDFKGFPVMFYAWDNEERTRFGSKLLGG